MKNNPHLAGRRAILWMRCSTLGQADTSLSGQQHSVESFAKDNGLTIADTIDLPGISASLVGNLLPFINELVARKQTTNDFDVLLVYDLSRFCRAGARQGFSLENQLSECGIELVQIVAYQPPSDHKEIVDAIGYMAAQQFAKSLASSSARGMQQAIENGSVTHSSQSPWGLDRLYLKDGKPQRIIRRRGPDCQESLDPETGKVTQIFDRGDIQGKFGYKRQRGETSRFVPGDNQTVEQLRQMFRWHYVEGTGFYTITQRMNERGWKTFTGERWSSNGVQRILRNPIYIGKGLANHRAWGIYFTRSKGRPVENKVKRLSNGKTAAQMRPEDQWEWIEEPLLADLLPPEVKAAAEPKIMEYLRTPRYKISPETRKTTKSKFYLSGLMRSTSGHSLIGKNQGSARTDRYYKSQYGGMFKSDNPVDRRCVNASKIEAFVEQVLRQVIEGIDNLEEIAVAELNRCGAERQALKANPTVVRKEMQRVVFQIAETHARMTRPELKTVYGPILDRLENDLAGLQTTLSEASEQRFPTEEAVRQQARQLIELLKTDAGAWATMDGDRKHRILKALGTEVVIDLATLEAEVRMSLPKDVCQSMKGCGLTVLSERPCIHQATVENRLILASSRASVAVKPKVIRDRKSSGKTTASEQAKKAA